MLCHLCSFAVVSILTQTWPKIQWDSAYLPPAALTHGKSLKWFVLFYFGQWARFFLHSSISIQVFQFSALYYDGHGSIKDILAVSGALVSGVQHFRIIWHMVHSLYFLVLSMEEFWELLPHHLPLGKTKSYLFPVLLLFLWGGAEKLGKNVYLHFTCSHIIYT